MLAADVSVYWEADRIDIMHLSTRGDCYVIGEHAACHHMAPGLSRHALARLADDAVVVFVPGSGDVRRLTLGEHTFVTVGTLTFQVSAVKPFENSVRVAAPARKPAGPSGSMGGPLLAAATFHLMAAALLVSLPRDVSRLDFDAFLAQEAAMRFVSLPELNDAPTELFVPVPEVPVARDTATAARSVRDDAAPRRQAVQPPADRLAARELGRTQALSAATAVSQALGDVPGLGGLEDPLLGRSAADALGMLDRGTDARALFGDLETSGPGRPGGAAAVGPGAGYDVGRYATLDGGGEPGERYGRNVARLGTHKPKVIVDRFQAGPVELTDGLDLETVRRVIRNHLAEYRYCYEKQLNVNHDLAGKVTLKFVIGGQGDVIAVNVDENTSGEPALGACLSERIRRWTFPAPASGGRVVVRYPFVFKAQGG